MNFELGTLNFKGVDRWNPFLRWPGAALTVAFLLCVPFWLQTAGSHVSARSRILLESDQRNFAGYETVKDILAHDVVAVVSLECSEVFSRDGIRAIRLVSDALLELPGVVDVKSLTHSVMPVRRGVTFEMVPLVSDAPTPMELRSLRRFCTTHPLVKNVMVAPDGRHTLLLVTFHRLFDGEAQQRAMREQIAKAIASCNVADLQYRVVALPLIEEEMRRTFRNDVRAVLPVAGGLMVLVLGAAFRPGRLLALFVVNLALSLGVLPGVLAFAGFELNVFSAMLLPLLAAVHLTLLVHLFTAFQQARQSGVNSGEAVRRAQAEVFVSCAFAAITTIAGLLSFTVTNLKYAREFGLAGSLGVAVVFALTFGPGLALLRLAFPNSTGEKQSAEVQGGNSAGFWDFFAGIILTRRQWIRGAAVGAILLAAWGITRVRTDLRAVEFLGRQSETRQAVEELDRVYGGINVAQIEIDSGASQGANTLEFLRYLESVQKYAEGRAGVSGIYSYAQLLAMMNQLWDGGAAAALQLPETPVLVKMFAAMLKAGDYPFLAALTDPSFRTATVIVRTRDLPADQYLKLLADIVGYAEQHKPANARVSAAKGLNAVLEADRRMLRSVTDTAAITVGAIGLVLALLWRSVPLACAAVGINLIPVAVMLALAGFADLPLNSFTVMVGAIVFGIAVDDAVHFITHWRVERQKGLNAEDALRATLRLKGRAIVVTSLVLMGVFGALALASFPPVVHFGVMSAAGLALALDAVLLLLPVALNITR
ncbi:MAG: MMPL family transporter [Verrucomicrobiota bacterium]